VTDDLDMSMVRTWLDVLFIDTPGLIHICSTGNWSGQAFADHDQAAGYIARLHEQQPVGIYLRATTLNRMLNPGERGGEADAAALPGLWADLDIGTVGHADADLPPDEDAARKVIATSGLPEPTLWVHSGGGLYPWWLFDQPVLITDDNLADVRALSGQWQQVIAHAAKQLGWKYGTGIGDLARVLRIPGTINRKEGLARPCTVLDASPDRYTYDELRAALGGALATMPASQPAPRHLTAVPRTDGGISPGDDFEQRVDWGDPDLLGGADWRFMYERGNTRYWQRPGKSGGHLRHHRRRPRRPRPAVRLLLLHRVRAGCRTPSSGRTPSSTTPATTPKPPAPSRPRASARRHPSPPTRPPSSAR
jgi:hypothetical protein